MNHNLFEPITYENIRELTPGQWIWDNKIVIKTAHERSMSNDKFISEPVGFRQVHILSLDSFPRFTSMPFMLSEIDDIHYRTNHYAWEYFEEGRFYKFKNGIHL